MADRLLFAGVSKRYREVPALRDVTLSIGHGEILGVIGHSGSGKTTLLHICAGVVAPSSGEILMDGVPITHLAADRRDIGIVFQSFALFPHLSVRQNVLFPLQTRRHRTPHDIALRLAEEMLDQVGLGELGDRRPQELSGGQQQRVALARALVFRPRVLLLDEPLGALDAQLKDRLQDDIRRLRDDLDVSIIYVTHDLTEAMAVSDRIAVLHDGLLQQVGAPQDIYRQPVNEVVARLVGAGNFLPGRISGSVQNGFWVSTALGELLVGPCVGVPIGEHRLVLIRPENIALQSALAAASAPNQIRGIIASIRFLGAFQRVFVEVEPDGLWMVDVFGANGREELTVGSPVKLSWHAKDASLVATSHSAVELGNGRSPLNVGQDLRSVLTHSRKEVVQCPEV